MGEQLRPQIKTKKMADLNEDDILKLIQLQRFLLLGAFSSLSKLQHQHQQQNNTKLSSYLEDSLEEAILMICPCVSHFFILYGTAHAELLCACC